jgi:hypothetical protein
MSETFDPMLKSVEDQGAKGREMPYVSYYIEFCVPEKDKDTSNK